MISFLPTFKGLVPNAEEMVVLANLTEAQENLARENETQRLDSDFLEPPTPTFPPGFGRKKRQAQRPPTFDEQVVLVALDNENACNPVLRSSARSIIEEFGRLASSMQANSPHTRTQGH